MMSFISKISIKIIEMGKELIQLMIVHFILEMII